MAGNAENRDHDLLDRAAAVLRESVPDPTQAVVTAENRSLVSDRHWPALETLARSNDGSQPKIGDMPPQPPTWRGRIGAMLVAIVQRALFWYSQQIGAFQQLVTRAAHEQLQALERFAAEANRNRAAIHALNSHLEQMQRLAEQCRADSTTLNGRIEHLDQQNRNAITTMDARVERLDEAHRFVKAARAEDLQELRGEFSTDFDQLSSELKNRFAEEMQRLDRLLHESRVLMLQQSLRVTTLIREFREQAAGAETARALADGSPEFGDFLRQHADVFRGSAAEIRDRLSIYLPVVRNAVTATLESPVLDLGCGRGEWLELLREGNIPARGVDVSPAMVRTCLDQHLDVVQSGVLEYLRVIPDHSLSAITAFHVLEHLPWQAIVEIVDQTVRLLKPDGVAIFETPNPRNLQVATYNFYLDPTHIRPLPSELLSFLMKSRGLEEPETIPLHSYPNSFHLKTEDGAADFLNQMFFGAQDYAVIAKKL